MKVLAGEINRGWRSPDAQQADEDVVQRNIQANRGTI